MVSTPEPALRWRKSGRCDTAGCVEVARTATGVALRDSTLPADPFLRIPGADWQGFLAGLRAGRY